MAAWPGLFLHLSFVQMKRFLPLWFSFYLASYCLPFPLGFIPGTTSIIEFYFRALSHIADWVGVHILGLSPSVGPIAGGDTRASYISVALLATFSLFATLAWIGTRQLGSRGVRYRR